MAITDAQTAALRAQLAGQPEEHKRLLGTLDPKTDSAGYATLVAAAFFEAVERRFGTTAPNQADVVEFVGDVRGRSEGIRERFSARDAERMIMHVFGEGSADDLSDKTVRDIQAIVTASIIGDEQLSDAELDSFMAEVRSVAERLVS